MNQKLKKFLAMVLLFIMCVCNNGTLVIATEVVNTVEESATVVEASQTEEPVVAPSEVTSEADSLEQAPAAPAAVETPVVEEPKETTTTSETTVPNTTDVTNSEVTEPTTETTEVKPKEDVADDVADSSTEDKIIKDEVAIDKKEEETKIPMPPAEFYDATDEVEVTVHAPEGAFPEGTKMVITPIIAEAIYSVVDNVVPGEVNSIKAVDITFTYNGVEIEPEVNISVSLKAKGMEMAKEQKVVHIDDNFNANVVQGASVNKVGNELIGDFTSKDFSVYAVISIDDEGNPTAPFVNYKLYKFYDVDPTGQSSETWTDPDGRVIHVVPYSFLNKAGETRTSQRAKNGDTLENVGVPFHMGFDFVEWVDEDGNPISFTSEISGLSTDTQQADEVINVYAKYSNVYYVYLYENKHGSSDNLLLTTKIVADGQSVDISDVKAPIPDSDYVFTGWKIESSGGELSADNVSTSFNPTANYSSYIRSDNTIHLYPDFVEVYWIRFLGNGYGASFTSPINVYKGKDYSTVTRPTDPTRDGYTFAGWYTQEEGGTLFNWTGTAQGDITLYAHWTPKQVQYTVVYWLENPDDTNYSYLTSKTLTGNSNSTTNAIGLTNNEFSSVSSENMNGFTMQTITQKTIDGEGTTVVNVYYKRNSYDIVFRRNSNNNEYTNLKITAKYGADIHAEWPGTKEGTAQYGALWRVQRNGGTYIAGLSTMPYNGHTYYSVDGGNHRFNWRLMTQNLDGSNNFTKYIDVPASYSSSLQTTVEDYVAVKGFTLNAHDNQDATAINNAGVPATYNNRFNRSPDIGTSTNSNTYETIDGQSYHTLYFYYLRNQYKIDFKSQGTVVKTVNDIYYEADISNVAPTDYVVNETSIQIGGRTYLFQGWYDNEAFAGDPYVFNGKTMPAGNLIFYAKWEEPWYIVQLELNGGSLNHNTEDPSEATWFWEQYGEKITEYTPERNFVEDSSGTYYYHNSLHPNDYDYDRLAYYTTDISKATDTTHKYSALSGAYAFIGWYEVINGEVSSDPFDFDTGVTHNTTLRAMWRRTGTYSVTYQGVVNGIGGNVGADNNGYADLARVVLLEGPKTITPGYVFDGWEIITKNGIDNNNGNYYQPGTSIEYKATEWLNIGETVLHIQAHYTKAENSDVPVGITQIVFNANGGTTTVTADPSHNISVSNNNVTISKLNINDNLTTYGSSDFTREGYRLMGWDTDPEAEDPEFKTNQLVGVDNLDPEDNTIYAIWAKESGYIIHYVEREDTNHKIYPDKEVNNLLVGTPIDETALPPIDGYDLVSEDYVQFFIQDDIYEWTFLYSKRTNLSYIVNYLEQGTNTVLKEAKEVGNQTYQAQVNETAAEIEGYTCVDPASGEATITIDVANNVINFYYKVNKYEYTVHFKDKDDNSELFTINDTADYKEHLNAADFRKVNPEDETYTMDEMFEGYKWDSYSANVLVIGTDPTQNVLTIYYTKRNDLKYTVNYLEKGTNNVIHTQKKVNNAVYNSVITAESEKIDIDGYNYDSCSPDSITIAVDETLNVINLYYTKRTDINYTVNYYDKITGESIKTPKTAPATFEQTITAQSEVVEIPGYNYDSANPTQITISTTESANVINLYYTKKEDIKYTVNFYDMDTNEVIHDPVTDEATFKDTIVGDDEAIEIAGYNYDHSDPTSIVISATESENVLNLYYTKKEDIKYTVNFYDMDTDEVIHDPVTDEATFKDTIVGDNEAIEIAGYNYDHSDPTSIVISATESENVLNLYYTKKEDIKYTVNFYDMDTDEVIHDPVTDEATFKDTIVGDNEAIEIAGYNYDHSDPTSIVISATESENVLNLYYTKKEDIKYTVNFYDMDTNEVIHDPVTDEATFKDTIVGDNEAIEIDGYNYNHSDPTSIVISATESENVLNLYYTKMNNLEYKVNYLEKGSNDEVHDPKTVGNKTFKDVVNAEDEVIEVEGYKFDSYSPDSITISTDASQNVINIYYTKRNDLKYTVNYLEKDVGTVLHTAKTVDNQTYLAEISVANEIISIDGYNYDSIDPTEKLVISSVESENVINIYYTKKTDLSYTIYYKEQATEKTLHEPKVEGNQIFGDSVYEEAIDIPGYNKVDPTSTNIPITTGDNEFTFYYTKKTNLEYTVNYLELNTDKVLQDPKTVGNKTFEDVVDPSTEIIDIDGYYYDSYTPSSLTISADNNANIINIYYTKRADLTYTVNYLDKDNNNAPIDGYDTKTVENQTYLDEIDTSIEIIDINGYYYDSIDPETLIIDYEESNNVINIYYTRRTDLTYTVNYLDKDNNNSPIDGYDTKTVENQKYLDEIDTSIEIIDINGYDYDSIDPETLTIDYEESNNVINIYYTRRTDLTYTVNYLDKDNNNSPIDGYDTKTVENQKYLDEIDTSIEIIDINGYDYDSIDPETLTIDYEESNNVINIYYTRRTDLTYTVNYLELGTNKELEDSKTVSEQTYLDEIDTSVEIIDIDGYNYHSINPETLTIDYEESNNVINIYYTKVDDLSYTVHYYEVGKTTPLIPDKTVPNQEFEAVITSEDEVEEIDGFTYDSCDPEDTLTIGTNIDENVITIYYTRNSYEYTINYLDKNSGETIDTSVTDSAEFEAVINGSDFKHDIDGYDFDSYSVDSITIQSDESQNVIDLLYTKRTDLSYTVHYYELGETTPLIPDKTVSNQEFDSEVTEEPEDIDGYDFNSSDPENATITITTDEDVNVITFYYTKRNNLEYTVHYYEKDTTNPIETDKTEGNQTFETVIYAADEEIAIDGFTYDSCDPESITIGTNAEENVIILYYTRNSYEYTINYLDKNSGETIDTSVTDSAEFEAVINGSDFKHDIDGYNFDSFSVESITIKSDESQNVIDLLYTKRNDLTYTVHYYELGETTPLIPDKTVTDQEFDSEVTEEPEEIDGYDYNSSDPENATITITTDAEVNVITFYYTKRNNLEYTVHYYEKDTTNPIETDKTEGNQTFETVIYAADEEIAIDGFTYDSCDPESITIGTNAEENVIILYYTRNSYEYTINYLDKDTEESIDTSVTDTAAFEDVINGSDFKHDIDGYNFDSYDKESITIASDETQNVINILYTKRNDLEYTVHYYEKDTTNSIETDKTEGNQTFKDVINASDEIITIDGFEYDSCDPESITIGTNAEENVIILYYTRNSYEYTVNYYYDKVLGETNKQTAPFEDTITITPEDSRNYNGNTYSFESIDPETGSIDITSDPEKNVINVYYFLDNLNDDDDTDEPGNPDGIPDEHQIKVYYQVENGKWNDGSDTEKMKVVTLRDETTGEPSKDGYGDPEVPEVGERPDTGYCEGDWVDEIPDKLDINNNGDKFKYVYEKDELNDEKDTEDPNDGDKIPDKYQIKVYFEVEHGKWNDGTDTQKMKVMTLKDPATNENSEDGEAELEIPEVGQRPDPDYCEGEWKDELPAKVNKDNNKDVYTYEYLIDKLNDNPNGDDDTENGDGNPDKYQIVLTYVVKHGEWDDETTDPKVDVVTLRDPATNEYSLDGEGSTEVPAVGQYPKLGYTQGDWDNPVPATVTGTQEILEFTYEFLPFTPTRHDPPVKKVIEGDSPTTDDTFVFTLTAISNTAGLEEMPMPEGSEGQTKQVEIVGDGEYEFGWIEFITTGTYVYQMKEENTGNANYEYDDTTYTVTYEITAQGTTLVCNRTITADDEEADECVFTNIYTKPTPPPTPQPNGGGTTVVTQVVYVNPKTGDDILLWISLMLFSLFAVLEVSSTMKRREWDN